MEELIKQLRQQCEWLAQQNKELATRIADMEQTLTTSEESVISLFDAEEQLKEARYKMRNFVSAVGVMRANQRLYFSTRDRQVLIPSKQSEGMVDKLLGEQFFIDLLK